MAEVSERALALYEKLVATNPEVERKGAAMPYTSINGNMFSFLTKTGELALRLPSDERDAFIKKHKTKLCEQNGAVMKEYVVVPAPLLAKTRDLKKYFDLSYAYVGSLKPKATTKPKKTAAKAAPKKATKKIAQPPTDPLFKKVEKICLALPDTTLTMPWNSPHFRVKEKIFAGCNDKEGSLALTIGVEPGHDDILIDSNPAVFKRTKYKGAILIELAAVKDWDQIRDLVLEGYKLRAPKSSFAKLPAAAPAKKKPRARTSP